jgi:hypothetical protein
MPDLAKWKEQFFKTHYFKDSLLFESFCIFQKYSYVDIKKGFVAYWLLLSLELWYLFSGAIYLIYKVEFLCVCVCVCVCVCPE